MRNLGLKFFSLIMAIALSYYVQSDSSESVIALTVPVELRGVPADQIVTAPFPREVQVSLKGPSYLIAQVYSAPPSFKVRVPQDVGTRLHAKFERSELGLPPNIQVMSIEPSEMQFTFDTIVRKEVPVQLVQRGSPKNGTKISETVIVPPRVTVTGPKSEVSDLKLIETEPLELKDISADTEKSLDLKKEGKLTELSSLQVHVRIIVAKQQIERKFEGIPVEIRSMHTQAVNIVPPVVNVEVSGPKDKIDAMNIEDIVPYVRLGAHEALGEKYSVSVDLPKSISLVVVEPAKVKVNAAPGAAAGAKGK